MSDYFNEYSSFTGPRSLPSPADTPYETASFITPYETPTFIRSKRSSRVTSSTRENSSSPPPLPHDVPDLSDRSRDGRSPAFDPRVFTPSLHASLVSEILSLKREVDAKNNLVENLETVLASTKLENEALTQQVSSSNKEVRKAKQQLEQLEKGTYDAVADLVKERDEAKAVAEDLRTKLDKTQRQTRRQDNDALKTHEIWEREKETWDNERRQLERRIHITESRLRAVVDEVNAQQALDGQKVLIDTPEHAFKDSALGDESDTTTAATSPVKHKRNMSSVSFRSARSDRDLRTASAMSRRTAGTPDLRGGKSERNLADELDIDEEDDYDLDDFEHADDELDDHERARRTMVSRQSSVVGEYVDKAKRVLGLAATEGPPSPTKSEHPKDVFDRSFELPPVREVVTPIQKPDYVDRGYQPSPPSSPPTTAISEVEQHPQIPILNVVEPQAEPGAEPQERSLVDEMAPNREEPLHETAKQVAVPPSPPDTPEDNESEWQDVEQETPRVSYIGKAAPAYASSSTQTDFVQLDQPLNGARKRLSQRDSLQPPADVPSIAIHPPTSRPSSPRPYVLPPGTRNASTQAFLLWSSREIGVQTEEIRVDKRPVKLPAHLLPAYLLPSPTFDAPSDRGMNRTSYGSAKVLPKLPPVPKIPAASQAQSPVESSPERSRMKGDLDGRRVPLRAIPLPRPVLAPAESSRSVAVPPGKTDGPLKRGSQYGVSMTASGRNHLAGMDDDANASDEDDNLTDGEPRDLVGSVPSLSRPPHGRFGLSEPPKVVPEDKEISPERRPPTSGSAAAPAPSIANSRNNSQRRAPPPKLTSYRNIHSRSPSRTSVASSHTSTNSAMPMPPFPIPTRSSSRVVVPHTQSEGSASPTPFPADPFAPGPARTARVTRTAPQREKPNLRKVQSATAIRQRPVRTSPRKRGRYKRSSPELTPVQSMALDSPGLTTFPIPELPTPLTKGPSTEHFGSTTSGPPRTADSSIMPGTPHETTLVDAIAATMVGEWMLKYIRKRKSFGVGEASPDYARSAEDGMVDITGSGIRHKRWVWLSPYERTIMWDTKQPSSGAALLGKKGRKLPIQSVLDVQDNTPLPKGTEATAFNRSILILTSQRALKFTAVNQERHELWMTALSFLARTSPTNELPPMPIMPPVPVMPIAESSPLKRSRAPSFGRASIRDSVRLAKGDRPRMLRGAFPSVDGGELMDVDGALPDYGAEFPAVPRLYSNTNRHQRKRSNTSPRLPPPLNQLRSFSSSAIASSSATAPPPPSSNANKQSFHSGSRRGSVHSPTHANFFEAVQGTVRMEAFVDPSLRDGVLYVPAPPPPAAPATATAGSAVPQRRKRGDSNNSMTVVHDKRRDGYVFDENGIDPFKGF